MSLHNPGRTHHASGPATVSATDGVLNALADPWIPVERPDGTPDLLSIHDTLTDAHHIRTLGGSLAPLERDAITRLLISLTGLALRLDNTDPDDEPTQVPAGGLRVLTDKFADYFWIRHPTHPFCQEWHLPQNPKNPKVRGLSHLDPQEPGESSSLWGASPRSREAKSAAIGTDHALLTRLIVTTRWHTKHGNGKDGFGREYEYGNPGDIAAKSLCAYWAHSESFARTLLANVPRVWLIEDSLPAYLDARGPDPEHLARGPLALWRTTYARNLPLVHWTPTPGAGRWEPTGFVLGPSVRPSPPLSDKSVESLRAMHEHDPSRLVTERVTRGVVQRQYVDALNVRLNSTEGFLRWYENHLAASLPLWRARTEPVLEPDATDDWAISVFAEISMPQAGHRLWLDWAVIPRRRLVAPTEMSDGSHGPRVLLTVVNILRSSLVGPLRLAAEGRTRYSDPKKNALPPALKPRTERMLLSALEEPLFRALDNGADPAATDFDAEQVADDMRRIAEKVFTAATEPLADLSGLSQVAAAQNLYRREIRRKINAVFAPAKAMTNPSRTSPKISENADPTSHHDR